MTKLTTQLLQALSTSAKLLLLLMLASFPVSARAEIEISAYGGYQTAPHSNVRTDLLGDDFVKWLGKSFDMPPYYGLRATYWQDHGWGYGFEANHAKVYADDPASYGYERLEFTDGLNLVTANIWRRFKPLGRVTPYAGVGVGLAIPHVDIKPAGLAHTFGYQITGPAVQLVLGASLPINDRWSVFSEYKGSYSMNKVNLDSGGGLQTNIITNALNVGVSWPF